MKELVRDLGAIGIFIGVMLETLITLIPSPLIPMVAGFSLIPKGSDFLNALAHSVYIIGLTGGIAATLGALIHYWIGFHGGRVLVERYGKYLGVKGDELDGLYSRLSGRSSMLSLFLMRLIPIFPLSVVSVGSGLLRIRVLPYALVTFIGCFLRYSALGLLGFMVGETYEGISSQIDRIEDFLIIILIAGFALYLLRRTRHAGEH